MLGGVGFMLDFRQELLNAQPLVSQLNELAYNLVYQDTSFLEFVESICQQANVEYIDFRDKPSTLFLAVSLFCVSSTEI